MRPSSVMGATNPAHLSGVELVDAIAELSLLTGRGRGEDVARLLCELNARSVDEKP